jgi:hypothetical protein
MTFTLKDIKAFRYYKPMDMWEILFMFATSTLTFTPIFASKYIKFFNRIPSCNKCIYYFPRSISGNEFDQCKKFGFISNNKTKEISYDNSLKQRSIGACGPTGKYFQMRPGNYRDDN